MDLGQLATLASAAGKGLARSPVCVVAGGWGEDASSANRQVVVRKLQFRWTVGQAVEILIPAELKVF